MKGCQQNSVALLPLEMPHRSITDKEFGLFQALIHRVAGIHLPLAKKELLMGRLGRRLRELGLKAYGAYYEYVMEAGHDELIRLLDAISTNETSFFREPRQFEFLAQHVFPEWKISRPGARRIRVWSAGCATGEEPYSLAMMLWDHLPPAAGWDLEIRATDLSTRALERARAGIWALEKAEEIPPSYLRAFMLKGKGSLGGMMKAGPRIRSIIEFERLNLNDDTYPTLGFFDLIFCRNVLMYFSAESRARVVERLLNHLVPTGYLFLGHAETLNGVTDRVRSVMPTVYVRVDEQKLATRADQKGVP
jgi:chemotaxis protein methyltransferase CheR